MYETSLYDYKLPVELIAQNPAVKRDTSRLLVAERNNRKLNHKSFAEIINYFKPGDLLIFNDTKVIPARLIGNKVLANNKKGAQCEVLLLEQKTANTWDALIKPGKRLKPGSQIEFGRGLLKAKIVSETDFGGRIIEFTYQGNFYSLLEEIGLIPLPPYIKQYREITTNHDLAQRYQTLYAKNPGSAAAPTAGLHFTNELLDELDSRGVNKAFVTLHTGLGTFKPIEANDIREHRLHREWYEIKVQTIELIRETKARGNKIIAVGTTSVRVLENIKEMILNKNKLQDVSGYTDFYIYPGYEFKIIDGLITNFHLPKSSLLVLVSAFAGREFILQAYEEAIKQKYRFYSFGDAMLII